MTSKDILTPSNKLSFTSGGTKNILDEERRKSTFSSEKMCEILHGGKFQLARRRLIMASIKNNDYSPRYNMTRKELLSNHVKEFIKIHKSIPNFVPTRQDISKIF